MKAAKRLTIIVVVMALSVGLAGCGVMVGWPWFP